MVALWHWFEAQNGVKDILAVLIATAVAHIAGWHPRQHQKTQEQIADRLDTSTPGGITELLKDREKR